ncbi:MAG: DNA replication/repair protein RecF [Cyclonatronaceae bacterium]
MRINALYLRQFRNHTETEITFSPGINLITGPNGVGKTNLIDAIHYLCMSRSFTTSSDQHIMKQGSSGFSLSAAVEGNIRAAFQVSCSYERGTGKQFSVNKSPLPRLTDLIGLIPVVVLSPEDKKITREGPAERRSFLDKMISQVSHSYLSQLVSYRKIVQQRNRLLSSAYHTRADIIEAQLAPWDAQLAKTGAHIIFKRQQILGQFAQFLQQSYERISGIRLRPHFVYKSLPGLDATSGEAGIEAHFKQLIAAEHEREIERQLTLNGPHRDDLVFYLDDMELRKFGSQGQHRLFALALKLAELELFSELLEDLPVFLLDDVFGDLDPDKIEVLTTMLNSHSGQAFITAANQSPFEGLIPFETGGANTHFAISHGPEITTLAPVS